MRSQHDAWVRPPELDPEEAADALLRDLRSSRRGLSGWEAARRLVQHGPNELSRRGGRRWPGELVRQFTHPLALLLWLAAALLLVVGSQGWPGRWCTGGEARGVVFATGMHTELGRIAALSERVEQEPSPLERQVRRVAWLIAAVSVLLALAFIPPGGDVRRASVVDQRGVVRRGPAGRHGPGGPAAGHRPSGTARRPATRPRSPCCSPRPGSARTPAPRPGNPRGVCCSTSTPNSS